MTTQSASFDVDLMKTAQLGDAILTELDRLRELDPVHWSAARHAWLIPRHEDAAKGFSGVLPLSVYNRLPAIQFTQIPAAERERRIPTLLKYVSKWIVETDPPEHPGLRKLLVKAFSKKVVEAGRPYVRERVALLLDKAERERELEFVEGIARQLPGGVILKLLGLPEENIGRQNGHARRLHLR